MPTAQNMKLAFPGLRGDFLTAQMDDYADAVKNGTVPDVVAIIQRRFFKRFPISLEDNEEPSPEWLAQVDDNAADPEIHVPDENSMTPDEFSAATAKHKELVNKLEKKKEQITRRLAYMYKKRSGPVEKDIARNDPMAVFRSKMGAGDLKKPRQKIPFNVWAANNRTAVDSEFAKRVVGVPAAQHAQLRSAVYKELFEALPELEQQGVIQEVAAEHALALREYEDILKSGASTLPQDRQRAIEYVPKFVEPILDTIAEFTGWKWSLQGGGPEPAKEGRLSMVSIHSGYTSGAVKMNFGRSERKAFRTQIMPLFGSFMKKCYTVEECKARALPPDHSATPVADLCAGEQWSVAYDVEDDDDDYEDEVVDDRPARNHVQRKADEQARAMDRARAAYKKFSTPSTASTRLTSSLDVLTPAATQSKSASNVKVGPPVGAKRTGKAKPIPIRRLPVKATTQSQAGASVSSPSTISGPQPTSGSKPADVSKPIVPAPTGSTHSHSRSGPPSPISSRPPSPIVSRPPSPVGSRHPPSPVRSRAPTPTVSRPSSPARTHGPTAARSCPTTSASSRGPLPARSRGPSPIRSRPSSPARSHRPSPFRSRPSSPARSRGPSPIRSRTSSPTRSPGPLPIRSRPSSRVRSHRPTPTRSRSPSPARSRGPSPIHSHPSSPAGSHGLAPALTPAHARGPSPIPPRPSSPTCLSGALPISSQAPLLTQRRVASGAVAVPDVSIPDVGSLSQGAASKKRKAASTEVDAGKNKRPRASTSASSSTRIGSAGTWEVAVPAEAPSWIIKAVKFLTRDDFGTQWRGLVDEWLRFEQASNFVDAGRLSSKGQPTDVAEWMRRRRSEAFRPEVDVSEFKAEFSQWWMGLRSAPRENGGWEGLTGVTGLNGLLSVLAALLFWRGGLSMDGTGDMDAEQKAWSDAVDSVRDVLKELK